MIFRLQFVASTALALSVPSSLKQCRDRIIGGGCIATLTAFPLVGHATEVIKVEADIPALIQVAKDNKDEIIKLAKSAAGAVKITRMPDNLLDFARDALAGDVLLNVNGIPLDASLLSTKGAIDVGLVTEGGELSLTVSSSYLPRLPLLQKRVVPLSEETRAEMQAERLARAVTDIPPFLDQPFFFDPFGQQWMNKNVYGSTALVVGLSYGASYAYFQYTNVQEELAAQRKKVAAADKRKEAAKKVEPKKKEKVPTRKPKKVVETQPQAASSDGPVAAQDDLVVAGASAAPVPDAKSATKKWYKGWRK